MLNSNQFQRDPASGSNSYVYGGGSAPKTVPPSEHQTKMDKRSMKRHLDGTERLSDHGVQSINDRWEASRASA